MGRIWKKNYSLEEVNRFARESIVEHVGIEFVEKGDNFITATMPVDKRTIQPLGILHGGASVVLAETLGSMASHMVLDNDHFSVGLEIKANHIKSVTKGVVTGTVRPLHMGKTTQIWDIFIRDDLDNLICVSRLTMMVLKHSES